MIEGDIAILYAISVVLVAAAISAIWFVQIQKRYKNKDKELTRKQNE